MAQLPTCTTFAGARGHIQQYLKKGLRGKKLIAAVQALQPYMHRGDDAGQLGAYLCALQDLQYAQETK